MIGRQGTTAPGRVGTSDPGRVGTALSTLRQSARDRRDRAIESARRAAWSDRVAKASVTIASAENAAVRAAQRATTARCAARDADMGITPVGTGAAPVTAPRGSWVGNDGRAALARLSTTLDAVEHDVLEHAAQAAALLDRLAAQGAATAAAARSRAELRQAADLRSRAVQAENRAADRRRSRAARARNAAAAPKSWSDTLAQSTAAAAGVAKLPPATKARQGPGAPTSRSWRGQTAALRRAVMWMPEPPRGDGLGPVGRAVLG